MSAHCLLSKKLNELLDLITTIQSSPFTAPALKQKAMDLNESLGNLKEEITFLEDMLPLNEIFGETQVISPAEFSPAKKGELIHQVTGKELEEHRKSLQIIDNFIRWGADPVSAYVFSERSNDISAVLGEEFETLDVWIRGVQFQLGKNKTGGMVPLPKSQLHILKKSIKRLSTLGVFDKSPKIFLEPKNKTPTVVWGIGDQAIQELFRGHWLTAYARWLILDHANRNEITTQIVTRLTLKLPKEVVKKSGVEYDLLAFIPKPGGGKIVWIECKAGSLKRVSDSVDSISTAKDTLIQSSNIGGGTDLEFEFLCLVTQPVTNNDRAIFKKLQKQLSAVDIKLHSLDELRSVVHQLFVS